jgi:hypothetical protein
MFPNLKVFTFDKVPEESSLSAVMKQIPKLWRDCTGKNGNLLLAGFQAMYEQNPHSHWYVLSEDDTIVVKENLELLLSKYNASKDVLIGKCVSINTKRFGTLPFVVGGAGIVMSGSLLRKLGPHITKCRRELQRIPYGDARITACMIHALHMNFTRATEFCTPFRYTFTNGSPWFEVTVQNKDSRFVMLHEKDPIKLKILNDAILNLTKWNETITWGALKPYLIDLEEKKQHNKKWR